MAKTKALKLFTTIERAWASTTSFCVIPYKGHLFWSAEQLARWKMCKSPDFREMIITTYTSKFLFSSTRDEQLLAKGYKLDPNYDREKEMLIATRKKFRYNPVLAEILIKTGDLELIYDNPYDPFFGLGRDGKGEGRYGTILEKVRREIATGKIVPHQFDSSLLDTEEDDDEPPKKKSKTAKVKEDTSTQRKAKKNKDDDLVKKVLTRRKPRG